MDRFGVGALGIEPRASGAHREGFFRSIVKGWHYAWRNESVRAGILCTTAVSLLIFPFATLLPVFARDLLGVGAFGEAGAVTTNDPGLASTMRRLRELRAAAARVRTKTSRSDLTDPAT